MARSYLPALGFDLLTPLYDAVVRLPARETLFKSALLDQADLRAGHRALDVGCGTGTLLELLGRRLPGVSAAGLDGDPRMLGRARRKLRRAGARAALCLGLADSLPFADRSLDRVLSTLMLHHLTQEQRRTALAEARRVLRPGGELHVADWGRPHNPAMRLLALLVQFSDGAERTRDNLRGRLPGMIEAAGFVAVRETRHLATAFGTLALLTARRPGV